MSWTDASPLRGLCSECGLGFAWSDVLHPTRSVPKWAIEHPQGFTVGRAVSCIVRALRPAVLWKRIRIEQPIRLRSIAWFVLLHLLFLHLACGLIVGIVTYIELGRWASNQSDRLKYSLQPLAWPYSTLPNGWHAGVSEVGVQCLALLGPTIAMPLAFLALGTTLAKARVKKVHLLRASALTLPITVLGSIFGLLGQSFGTPNWRPDYFQPLLGDGFDVWITWAALLLFFWSWWLIISRYLRLEQPRAVMVAMTTIALLTSFLLVVWGNLLAH